MDVVLSISSLAITNSVEDNKRCSERYTARKCYSEKCTEYVG